MASAIDLELTEGWQRPSGIFVIAEVGGEVGERIREIQERFDPKLAKTLPPHITIVGSSGLGPIAPDTSPDELRAALSQICLDTEPMELPLGTPHRFMQTDIVVLSLDPHGPIRELHDRIGKSGLTFSRARFAFTPHVTLSFYRTLDAATHRALMAVRVNERVRIDSIRCSLSNEPLPPRTLVDFELAGSGALGTRR
jgi:2'-5' RNA ligase